MPHIIVEYTDNIANDSEIPALLKKINETLIAQDGVFPTGGIRARAIMLTDYYIADGSADDAFVHATLKIAPGRSDEVKKKTCDNLFQMMEEHFVELFETWYIALSMELVEFGKLGTYKKNNIHERFR
ncbi:5-carboxymethyl-2-hydroxymuconate Delta-isomerase [Virgibacillus ihumii]|uniref:5-carboxymethyl-2-hydroxymuconate Delta-isomerase n=1 Tax=Virgibacillus ihumii TaxID=2686091 RepID=UPI00157BECCF|nr:5-carboxymethyl-2-hydroxymuconate Delta-isomerase [Virgibacillus ihumii]